MADTSLATSGVVKKMAQRYGAFSWTGLGDMPDPVEPPFWEGWNAEPSRALHNPEDCPRRKKHSTQRLLGPESVCAIETVPWLLLLSFLTWCQLSLPKGWRKSECPPPRWVSQDRRFQQWDSGSSISLQIGMSILLAFHYFSPCWSPLFSCFVIWLTDNKWGLFLHEMSCSSKELK